MKKSFTLLLTLTMLFLFTACSESTNNEVNNTTDNSAQSFLTENESETEKEYYISEINTTSYYEGSSTSSSKQEFYNSDSKLIKISHSGNPYIDITYDELGRIKSIYDAGTATLTFDPKTIEFNYENNSASTDVDSGNIYGITNITINYDDNNKLKEFKAKYSEKNDSEYKYDLSYEYYDDGKLKTISSAYNKNYYDTNGNVTISEGYTSDSNRQIISALYYTYESCKNSYFVKEQQQKEYTYNSKWDTEPASIDLNKNNCWTRTITEETNSTVTISTTYASDNSNVVNPYSIEAYRILTFDTNGNLTSEKQYNANNELIRSTTYTWSVK